MSKKLTFALSLALAVLPMTARALGLGEIKLNSALNDKFSADIQVVGATSDELDSLDVKLAGIAQFTQAGLDHPGVLDQLQFIVVRNPDGTAYVHITSTQPVREPFLDFLIDANWNNGELIREYTVLLNPPSFQTANAAKPESAPAPATVTQAPAPVAAAPLPSPAPAVASAQPTAPAPVAVAPQLPPAAASATTPESTAPPPTAPAPSVEQAPAQRALGTNYGPIHRGETLSGIAKSVRPEGVTLNQMMIAIYQANPEVFMHNINRMKAGYILRMPTASDAQAISVADANAQVREQIETWRNKTPAAETPPPPASTAAAPAAPALQLVAPSSAASSNAPVPGAEKQGSGETTVKGANQGKQPETAAAPPAVTTPASQAPIAVNNNALAQVQQQAAQQNATPSPNVLPPPSAATNVPLPKPVAPQPKPAVPAESGGGIMDMLFSIYSLFALIAIAVIVLLVVMVKKRKGKSSSGAAPGRIKGADWMKQEQVGGGTDTTEGSSTTRTKAGKAKKAPVEDSEKTVLTEAPTEVVGGDSDKTMLMAAPPIPTGDTMVGGAPAGGGSAKLDVSDPMAEADFHMAYGLYDQAADVLKKALRQEPGRRELQVKLLEVFFTAGDKANFVGEAKKLRQSMGATPDKDWESVAIMGRQVAPEDPLFTSTGAPAGGGAVDIALDGGGTGTVVGDMDALTGAFSGEPPSAPSPAPAPAPAADNSMDFSIPDLEPTPAAPAPAAPAPQADAGMEFNLGDLNFEPTPAAPKAEVKKPAPSLGTDEPTVATDFGTDSQVEFDKALNDLASFVNTNVPAQPADETHDKTMAIRPPKGADMGAPEPVAAESAATGGGSMSEIGTKLDLARAYIDMGDPDGAKSILEEVVAEGSAQQKQEAQELLKHVS